MTDAAAGAASTVMNGVDGSQPGRAYSAFRSVMIRLTMP